MEWLSQATAGYKFTGTINTMRGLGKSFLLMTEKAHQTITEAHQELPLYIINAQRPWASIRHSQGSQSRLRKHPRSISEDRRRWETAKTRDMLSICNLDSSVDSLFFPPSSLDGRAWGGLQMTKWKRSLVPASEKSQHCRRTWPAYAMGDTQETGLDLGPLNNGSGG